MKIKLNILLVDLIINEFFLFGRWLSVRTFKGFSPCHRLFIF